MTDGVRRALCGLLISCSAVSLSAAPALGATRTERTSVSAKAEKIGNQPSKLEQRAVELRDRVAEAQAAHSQAIDQVQLLEEHLLRLLTQSETADRSAEDLYLAARRESGGAMDWLFGSDDAVEAAQQAAADAEHMRALVQLAEKALRSAHDDVSASARKVRLAEAAASELSVAVTAKAAATSAARRARFSDTYRAGDADQDRFNRAALKRWLDYLDSLAELQVVPPAAEDMVRPGRLPKPLQPIVNGAGQPVKGVAQVYTTGSVPLPVVPFEAVRAVSDAFGRTGVQSVDADTTAYACGGFLVALWGGAPSSDLTSLWQETTTVPVRQLQIGDAVFLADEDGRYGAGIYVGDGTAIVFDANGGEVAAERVRPRDMIGVRRMTVEADRRTAEPLPATLRDLCGLTPPVTESAPLIAAPGSGWVSPLVEGAYSVSATFGLAGPLWASGQHTGHDFAAALGTPVYAARAGVVTVEDSSWAGQLVRVDHGGGVESWYAHMSGVQVESGDALRAGQVIGAVGSEGNSTGPHLHFEVRVDGIAVDPVPVLAGQQPTG